MASIDARQPLLSGPIDPKPKRTNAFAPMGRKFRRCESAPVDSVSPDIPLSKSISGTFHPSIRQVGMYLAVYLGVGTVIFYLVMGQIDGYKTNGLVDAVYFCIVTMTTVGYGDLVPASSFTKLLACVFVFSGMALISVILTKAADYLVEKQEILLVRALCRHRKVGPSDFIKEIETNKVKYKCLIAMTLIVVLILFGAGFLSIVEELHFIDAFYCACSTMTTLGYGDKSFSTTWGRIFAVVWILTSTLGLGQFLLYVAELFTETRQKALVEWVLTRRMTILDLEAADIDHDGVVGAAEFIVYKLKELGKINEQDIALVLEEFEYLDADHSGTISASDLVLSQSEKTKK
ncbi:Ion_trans_2 domain-containing protein [Cephalotus follicularis]|uniref:Ion_trans_2 domain-containing protein n=1 Tax=Cephalotus follicularis TaxID=3775 RepID=A0A1Q3BM75_CEPFO|nr:Ion_trans_2 domain-containing protein [Cephalotus follicularis]